MCIGQGVGWLGCFIYITLLDTWRRFDGLRHGEWRTDRHKSNDTMVLILSCVSSCQVVDVMCRSPTLLGDVTRGKRLPTGDDLVTENGKQILAAAVSQACLSCRCQ